jgi:hypothetical protein
MTSQNKMPLSNKTNSKSNNNHSYNHKLGAKVYSLSDLCTYYIADNLESSNISLDLLPEEIVQQLLYIIYIRGLLTPANVKLFLSSGSSNFYHIIYLQNILTLL